MQLYTKYINKSHNKYIYIKYVNRSPNKYNCIKSILNGSLNIYNYKSM